MKDIKNIKRNISEEIENSEELIKRIVESGEEGELIAFLRKVREGVLEIDIKLIAGFLIHQSNGIKEAARDIILSKIHTSSESGTPVSGPCSNVKKDWSLIFNMLVSYLKNPDPDIRNLSVEILTGTVDHFLDEIGDLFNCENEDIKIYACQILGNSKDYKSIDFIRQALNDKNINVKNCAIIALEETSVDYDISFLIDILKTEKEPWVKFSIIEVINKKGSTKYLKELIPLIKVEPDFIKQNILKAFVQYCDKENLVKLIENSNCFPENLNKDFNKAVIDILNSKNLRYSDNKTITDYLIRIIEKEPDPWNKYQAMKLLSYVKDNKDKKLLNLLKDNLNSPHPLIRTAAAEAIANYPRLKAGPVPDDFFDNANKDNDCENNIIK